MLVMGRIAQLGIYLLLYFNSSEYSLFVGELTEDVDDLILFNAFKKYPSCRSAKGTLSLYLFFYSVILIPFSYLK